MPENAPPAPAATVAAVVTAYRPGDRLVPLVRALLAQTATVVVVDDTGGAPDAEGPLVEVEAAGARVIRHRSNRGIAAALNTGIAAARRPDDGPDDDPDPVPRFVLTFDQDSAIGDDFVATLVTTFEQAMAAGLPVGLVAPARIEGLPSQVTGYSRGFLLGTTPIQSGMLLPVTTLDRVGGFAEPLFIDGVDTDYALRVTASGLRVLLADRAALGHSLGDRFQPALLTRLLALAGRPPIGLVVSRPFRYYYLLRNRVLLNRRHSRGALGWALR
ncbi:glycosyltransferase, partial [Herbiconiux sp.]|uniref:glycosyltransferase n=1 Tax=Herbiconiux sp. TaxID=1871186 RepID=UPI0025C3FF0F